MPGWARRQCPGAHSTWACRPLLPAALAGGVAACHVRVGDTQGTGCCIKGGGSRGVAAGCGGAEGAGGRGRRARPAMIEQQQARQRHSRQTARAFSMCWVRGGKSVVWGWEEERGDARVD